MAISQQDYFLKPGESISAYNARIAALRGDTPAELASTQKAISEQTVAAARAALPQPVVSPTLAAFNQQMVAAPSPPPPSPIGDVIEVSSPEAAPPPPLPQPAAPDVQENYIKSLQEELEKTKTDLKESEQKKLDDAKSRIDQFAAQQEEYVKQNVEPLTSPFRQKLEDAERERLYITENFEANQKLTNELDSLLTEGNALIEQQRQRPVASVIGNRMVAKTMEQVAGRAGVIQAVMAARNGQINVAERMIDRSVAAITADRNDQINYFNTLLKLKEDKFLKLEKAETDFAESEVKSLQSEVDSAQERADFIKKAMIDPDTAQAYADAGITLDMTPEQIAKKLGDYAYTKEVADLSNEMAKDGQTYLAPGKQAPAGTEVVTTRDSRGVTKQYYKKATGGISGGTVKITPEDERTLIGAGFKPEDIPGIQSDVETYGIEKTIEGLPVIQQDAIKKVYGVESVNQFLTADYLKNNFFSDEKIDASFADSKSKESLIAFAKSAGVNFSYWKTDKTDIKEQKDKIVSYLEGLIETYRTAGFTDKEILNKFQ